MEQFEGVHWIGQAMDRVDGPLKVSGAAAYAAEHDAPGLLHGYLMTATIARGRLLSVEAEAARALPGVVAVITPFDAPRLDRTSPRIMPYEMPALEVLAPPLFPLQTTDIRSYGQPVAIVVAETFELARHAAALVRPAYAAETPKLDLHALRGEAFVPDSLLIPLEPEMRRGASSRALAGAAASMDAVYETPHEVHAQMEPGASVAAWEGDRLTVHTCSQDVYGWRQSLCNTFQIPPEQVRVVSRYIGGGFGGKNGVWDHPALAALAARVAGRPVKLVMTRPQMWPLHGHRAKQEQRIRLGAEADGRLVAIQQEILVQTSDEMPFVEHTGETTGMIYACKNIAVKHQGVRTDIPRATIMRAPGSAPGMFALESAMDELAAKLDMDPVTLRLRNDTAEDAEKALPFSTRSLSECFRQGAARFGWERRSPRPGSMRDGRWLVGMGCASAAYPAQRLPCGARVRMGANGGALVQIAATDPGTGSYTVLTQVAADALGVSPDRVRVEMGDTDLPRTPGSGGSWGAVSFGSAVLEACAALRAKFAELDEGRGEGFEAILTRHGRDWLEADAQAMPDDADKRVSMFSFGAQFAEVRIDPDTFEIRVPRFVGAYGVGRRLNEQTARSQLLGGITWGLGMALLEESVLDLRHGHFVNANLGEYHVPVNADMRDIDVLFVDETERELSALGAKGLGEVGIVGVAAAVANAVWHATGVRVRSLPITLDKVMAGMDLEA